MTENPNKNRLSKLDQDNPGFITGMSHTLQLVFRLLMDRRVSFLVKLLPIGALVYLFSPLDAAIPAVDDALVIGLGTYTFLELCPLEIVEEHKARITGRQQPTATEGEVVDVDYTPSDED